MGYYSVDYNGLRTAEKSLMESVAEWKSDLADVRNSLNRLSELPSFQGEWAASERAYISEVHGFLLGVLGQLLNTFSDKLVLYSEGYLSVDSDESFVIPEQDLKQVEAWLKTNYSHLETNHQTAKSALFDVYDIAGVDVPSMYSVTAEFENTKRLCNSTGEDVESYEQSHAEDMDDINQLIASTRTFIANYSQVARSSGYVPGSAASLDAYHGVFAALSLAAAFSTKNNESISHARAGYLHNLEVNPVEAEPLPSAKEIATLAFTDLIGDVLGFVSAVYLVPKTIAEKGLVKGFAGATWDILNKFYETANDLSAFVPLALLPLAGSEKMRQYMLEEANEMVHVKGFIDEMRTFGFEEGSTMDNLLDHAEMADNFAKEKKALDGAYKNFEKIVDLSELNNCEDPGQMIEKLEGAGQGIAKSFGVNIPAGEWNDNKIGSVLKTAKTVPDVTSALLEGKSGMQKYWETTDPGKIEKYAGKTIESLQHIAGLEETGQALPQTGTLLGVPV